MISRLLLLSCILLIKVTSSCQPPIQYHSSAAYGSPQFHPDSQQVSEFQSSPSIQSSLEGELVQNAVQGDLSDNGPSLLTTTPLDELSRPSNPFVPIEALPAEKSAHECSTKVLTSFMDVLDCTSVETYNTEGATARYGSNECSFDPQNLCRFYSDPDEELQFRRGIFAHQIIQQNSSSQFEFSQFEDSFSSLTKRPLGSVPSKNFLVIAEPFGVTPTAAGILQTDIRCQVGNGELSFDYWTTIEDAVLKVCTRVGQDRRCTSDIVYSIDSTSVQIQVVHPETSSFVVEIILTELKHPGFFIIDNVKYQADLCEITSDFPAANDQHLIARPSSARAFSRPSFNIDDGPFLSINGVNSSSSNSTFNSNSNISPPPGIETTSLETNTVPAVLIDNDTRRWSNTLKIQKVSENPCNVVDCNFNRDLCRYIQPELENEEFMHGKWQTANLRLDSNGLSRKSDEPVEREGFAFVGMSDRSIKAKGRKLFILESGEFQLHGDATLSFDLYRRSNAISLQVCVDSLTNCLYEASPVRSTSYWKLGETVFLPKGSKKIYFVAEQLKRFKWLALDNLKLLSDECSGLN